LEHLLQGLYGVDAPAKDGSLCNSYSAYQLYTHSM